MALDTYANIKTALDSWLRRNDLTNDVDDILFLAEQRLSEDLRIRVIESALSVTISSGEADVPADFLEMKHAHIVSGGLIYPLELKETPWIYRKFPTRESVDKPEFMGIDGQKFIFGPYPDATYTVQGTYYAKPAVLSDSNTTNAWIDNVPDALFYAALAEASVFLINEAAVIAYQARYEGIRGKYIRSDKRKTRRSSRVSYN